MFKSIGNHFTSILKTLFASVTMVLASLFLGMSSAHAALNEAVTSGFSSLTSDFNSLLELIWPLLILVVGAFWVMKLVKSGVRRAG